MAIEIKEYVGHKPKKVKDPKVKIMDKEVRDNKKN